IAVLVLGGEAAGTAGTAVLRSRESRKEQKKKRGGPARHAGGSFPEGYADCKRPRGAGFCGEGPVCYKAPAEAVWLGGGRCSGEGGGCSTRAVSRICSRDRTTRSVTCTPCSPISRSGPVAGATRPCAGRHVGGA